MSEIGLTKDNLDTPFLWVDLDQLERNIDYLARYFKNAGVNWRPHIKGIRVPDIAQKAIAAGAIGVTCATLGEGEAMAAAGIQDILIANQVVSPRKIVRLADLRQHADVKVAVDNRANVSELGVAASAKGVELGVLVELDTGMGRAGVLPGQPTLKLSRLVHQTPGMSFRGLMAWEGHTRAIANLDQRREAIEKAVGLLTESAARCREAGLPVSIVSGGGSGTYYVTAFQPGITEIQAGGAVFCDVSYENWGVETQPALFVRTTITSRPAPDRIILDAGFKTLPDWKATPRPIGIANIKSIHVSAEHWTVVLEAADFTSEVGDAFDVIVGYGDSTVFLHDRLYGIRNGIVEVIWPVLKRTS